MAVQRAWARLDQPVFILLWLGIISVKQYTFLFFHGLISWSRLICRVVTRHSTTAQQQRRIQHGSAPRLDAARPTVDAKKLAHRVMDAAWSTQNNPVFHFLSVGLTTNFSRAWARRTAFIFRQLNREHHFRVSKQWNWFLSAFKSGDAF